MNLLRRLGRDAAYTLLGLPLAVLSFGLLVPFFAVSLGTLVIYVGVPLLALTLLVARGLADLERVRLALLGRAVLRPRYPAPPAGAGWFRRIITPLRQGQPWLDLLYGVFRLPVAIVTFVLPVVWWAIALGGLSYGYWQRFLPHSPDGDNAPVRYLMGADTETNRIILYTITGAVALLTLYPVQRLSAAAQAGFAELILTRLAQLQGRIEDLTESRAAAVSAEADALRRLERDIHDGPQQRLIRLGMELSRAQRQLRTDPGAAAATIDDALGQTRETLDELRALSRGIAPPVLADRGLTAALTTLASRSTVPARLTIEVAERLPAAVENAIYFTAAEALANVAKHSGASTVDLSLARQDGQVYLSVTDDGRGGAHLAKGHGLAGLADRLRAVDGDLTVVSPPAGPTVLTAAVPCE